MVTSEWMDVINMVATNNLVITDADWNECNEQLVAFVKQGGKTSYGALLHWAIGVGPDKKLELSLQCLPATSTYLAGKPTLQG